MTTIKLNGKSGEYTLTSSQKNKGLFIGFRHTDQQPVCAKKIKYNNEVYLQSYKRFTSLKHSQLAQTLDLIEYNGALFVIREFHKGTSLKTILEKRSLYHKINEHFFIKLTIELLKALKVLHEAHVLHLDIKPSNIIIRHNNNESPKEWDPENIILIDFEQSLCYPAPSSLRSRFTLIYSPPEQLLNRLYLLNPSSDISAVGIVLYEMIAGSAPYIDCNAEIVANLQLTYPIKKRPTMHEDFFAIIQKATHKASFPKPPRMLDSNTIDQLLIQGIEGRYQSCVEMIVALEHYLNTIKDQPTTYWHRWLKRLGF